MERGKFIILEGIDGSGKSTQARMLVEELRERGVEVLLTAEHTDGPAGKLVEQVVKGRVKMAALALQMVFVADRIDHTNGVIRPALEVGRMVVSDRYYGSTVAYGAEVADKEWLLEVNKRVSVEPDLIFWIDVPAEVAMERMNLRGDERTIFEKAEKLQRVADVYKWLLEREKNWTRVDGNREELLIRREIMVEIEARGWV